MYKQVEWMTPADQEILQVLSSGLWLSPGNITRNTGYGGDWVRKRCSEMADRGVIIRERAGDPFYKLSSLGEKIHNREISAREVKFRTTIPSDYEIVDEE